MGKVKLEASAEDTLNTSTSANKVVQVLPPVRDYKGLSSSSRIEILRPTEIGNNTAAHINHTAGCDMIVFYWDASEKEYSKPLLVTRGSLFGIPQNSRVYCIPVTLRN